MIHYSADGETPLPVHAVPFQRTSITGRAVLDRKTVHHADIVPLLDSEYPDARENASASGFRAVLAVPLMREAARTAPSSSGAASRACSRPIMSRWWRPLPRRRRSRSTMCGCSTPPRRR